MINCKNKYSIAILVPTKCPEVMDTTTPLDQADSTPEVFTDPDNSNPGGVLVDAEDVVDIASLPDGVTAYNPIPVEVSVVNLSTNITRNILVLFYIFYLVRLICRMWRNFLLNQYLHWEKTAKSQL